MHRTQNSVQLYLMVQIFFDSYFEKSNLQGTTWQEAVLEEVYFNKADLRVQVLCFHI